MKRRKNGKIDEKNNEWRFYFAPKSQNGKNEFYFKIRERCELKQSLILQVLKSLGSVQQFIEITIQQEGSGRNGSS